MTSIELTDPSQELANLVTLLRQQSASSEMTWTVMQKAMGQGEPLSTEDYWHAMAIVRSRVRELAEFAERLEDKEFRPDHRTQVAAALKRLGRLFEFGTQQTRWDQTLSKVIVAEDGLTLHWFSVLAQRQRPLRRLSQEDRQKLIAAVDEILVTLPQRDDVPPWVIVPLIDGLKRLRFTLRLLPFVGHAAAIEQIGQLFSRTIAAERVADEEPSESRRRTILDVLNLIALAATLFCLPDQTIQAFERYQGWIIRPVVESPLLPKPEQRLLPKPDALEPKDLTEKSRDKSS